MIFTVVRAMGDAALVVSHGEAALSVLRDQLPEQVRDLAISITTSEKEGYKQLEGAVRLLQSIVQSLRPNEQLRLIADLEASIIGMRGRIHDIDAEIGKLAGLLQLSAVPGQKIRRPNLPRRSFRRAVGTIGSPTGRQSSPPRLPFPTMMSPGSVAPAPPSVPGSNTSWPNCRRLPICPADAHWPSPRRYPTRLLPHFLQHRYPFGTPARHAEDYLAEERSIKRA